MAWVAGGVDLAELTTALATLFEDRIANQINRAVVLGQLLPVTAGQGKNIQWDAKVGTAVPTSAVLAEGADVVTWNHDTVTPAVLQYGTYHDAFAIGGLSLDLAAAAGNPAELANLLEQKLQESVTRLAAAIATGIYSGTGATGNILGLFHTAGGDPAGALQATGTYASISRAAQPQWASNVLANGGVERALTIELMREMDRRIYEASGKNADLIVCPPLIHEKYGLLLGQPRRYVQDVYVRGQKITLDGGYKALEFDGIPVIRDALCPAGHMAWLTTEEVHLKQPPMSPGNRGTVTLAGTPEAQFGAGTMRLTAKIKALAETGDHIKIGLFAYPQLQVKRPNACGQIADLPTT